MRDADTLKQRQPTERRMALLDELRQATPAQRIGILLNALDQCDLSVDGWDIDWFLTSRLREVNAESVTAALLERLRAENAQVRRNATYITGNLKLRAAIPLLIELMQHDPTTLIRCEAAASLGYIAARCKLDRRGELPPYALDADERAPILEALIDLLSTHDERLLKRVLDALDRIADIRSADAVARLLNHPTPAVQSKAALILANRFADSRAAPILFDELRENPHKSARHLFAALELKDRRFISTYITLVEKLDDGVVPFKMALVELLGQWRDPACVPVLEMLLYTPEPAGDIWSRVWRGWAYPALNEESLRVSVVKALGRIGGERALRAIRVALADQEVRVREAARDLLGEN
jgi:HEAT repeat protein